MENTLTVNAATNITGATTLGSTLSVSGEVYFANQLSVSGATNLADTLTVSGTANFENTLSVGGTVTLGTEANSGGTIETSVGTITIDPAAVGDDTGTLIIKGDLTVQGTTTTINSTQVDIGDRIINLSTGDGTVNCGISQDNTNIWVYNPTTTTWSTEDNDLTTGDGDITTNNATFTGNVVHANVTTTITEISNRIATLEKYFRVYNDGTIQIGDGSTATVYLPGTQHYGTTNTGTYYEGNYAGLAASKGTALV